MINLLYLIKLIMSIDVRVEYICRFIQNMRCDKLYFKMVDDNFKIIIDRLGNMDDNIVDLCFRF